MSRYFQVETTRGKGIAKLMSTAKEDPNVLYTLYVLEEDSSPLWLVGRAGAKDVGDPVMSFAYYGHTSYADTERPAGHGMDCWPCGEEG